MMPFKWIGGCVLALCAAVCALAESPPPMALADIVAKNAEARGGVQAWQQLKTMVWTGYVQSGAQPAVKLPFMLEQARPLRTRFEIIAEGQKSIRVFSGTDGWKIRVISGGQPAMQPYSADELKFAQGAHVIDGPLMDFATRGSPLALLGHDEVEGHSAYVLEARTAAGEVHRIWVDAQSFLEVRLDRIFQDSTGKQVQTTVTYRDYQAFEGLQLPVVVETGAGGGQSANRMVIERVALNPTLDDSAFARPALPAARHAGATVVDMRAPAPAPVPRQPRPVSPQ